MGDELVSEGRIQRQLVFRDDRLGFFLEAQKVFFLAQVGAIGFVSPGGQIVKARLRLDKASSRIQTDTAFLFSYAC